MKKFNENSLLFGFAVLFVISGLFSVPALHDIGGNILILIRGQSDVRKTTSTLESITSDKLNYHSMLMDINSFKENLLGTRIVPKEDITIIKTDSGCLLEQTEPMLPDEILQVVQSIDELRTAAEAGGAKFLYCAVPGKEVFHSDPPNARNFARQNFRLFLSEMASKEIPVLDFTEQLKRNQSEYPIFYNTDHHWTVRAGFDATGAILEELRGRYGLEYDSALTDLSNYHIEHYPHWFLGSYGKKVGTYFTWQGADDFELITPDFQTDLTEELPLENRTRRGDFKESALKMPAMEKSYYEINTYATYSGGNFHQQILTNHLNPQGAKVLLIRDSFACVVGPFLSLSLGQLHECDMRRDDYFVGDKLNMADYIQEIKPDYVLVLYYGVRDISNGRYDFF